MATGFPGDTPAESSERDARDRVDVMVADDPWARSTANPEGNAPQAQEQQGLAAPPYTSRAYATGATDAPPPRIIHDNPPGWSGEQPDRELEPYLKKLRGWLMTTRTFKTQQGMTIFNFATGDLNVIINELEIEELTGDDSG